MSDDPSPAGLSLKAWSLEHLQECCLEEMEHYRHTHTQQESICCLEIVRRAATEHKDETFAALINISRSIIQKRCPNDLYELRDDFIQEVATRLFRKFYHAEQPFQIKPFPGYINYVKMTCSTVIQDLRKQRQSDESLDNLRDTQGFEPAAPLPTDEIERRMLLERWLELLPDLQMRDAFRRRFALDETPDEIAQALAIPKKDVYRLVEQAIRLLRNIPEVREMLEA